MDKCEWCDKEKENQYGQCESCRRFPSAETLNRLNWEENERNKPLAAEDEVDTPNGVGRVLETDVSTVKVRHEHKDEWYFQCDVRRRPKS